MNCVDFLFWWEHFFVKKRKQNLKKKCFGLNLHQAKSDVISFLLGVSGGQKTKAAQNSLKQVLVVEFFKSDEFFIIL